MNNGRFSRLIADRYLKACKIPYTRWPIDLDSDCQGRKAYIQALKEADKGAIEPLVDFMIQNGAGAATHLT